MALTRLCPFCRLPLATECLCDDDDPAPSSESSVDEDDAMHAMASGLTVKRTAALGARAVAERKLALLRRAVKRVLDAGVPDTAAVVLREAMEASA